MRSLVLTSFDLRSAFALRHTRRWVETKAKASRLREAFSEIRGVPTVELVKGSHGGLGCCPIWQPRINSLPRCEQMCKTVSVKGSDIANKLGLVRGTPSPQKQRAAGFKIRYGIKAPDEYDEKDNPGNEQLFDAATGAASRLLASLRRVVNLSRSIPDLLLPKPAVAPSGKCQGTRLLWGKLSALVLLTGCEPHLRLGSPQFQHAPELICIIVIEPTKVSTEIAKEALNTCRATAVFEKEKGATK